MVILKTNAQARSFRERMDEKLGYSEIIDGDIFIQCYVEIDWFKRKVYLVTTHEGYGGDRIERETLAVIRRK